jgi:hypothetical protein
MPGVVAPATVQRFRFDVRVLVGSLPTPALW